VQYRRTLAHLGARLSRQCDELTTAASESASAATGHTVPPWASGAHSEELSSTRAAATVVATADELCRLVDVTGATGDSRGLELVLHTARQLVAACAPLVSGSHEAMAVRLVASGVAPRDAHAAATVAVGS
jgi:hypothetical protein